MGSQGVSCYCAAGYSNQTQPCTACLPVNCGTAIPERKPAAAAVCTGNTHYGGTPCRVSCVHGYDGNAVDYTCSAEGNWTGSIECWRSNASTIQWAAGLGSGCALLLLLSIPLYRLYRRHYTKDHATQIMDHTCRILASDPTPDILRVALTRLAYVITE